MKRLDTPQDIARLNKQLSSQLDATNKELKNLRVFSQQTHHQLTHVAGQQVLQNAPGSGLSTIASGVFTVRSAGPILMAVSGSAFSANPNTVIGFAVQVDGATRGTTNLFANPSATHLALPAVFLVFNLAAGSHTVKLIAGVNTSTDGNDHFNVAVVELQGSV